MLRISQRLIFHIISLVDGLLASVKESGQCAGIKFVEDPPRRINSKVPKPLVNSLAIESAENMFPLPDIPSVLSGLQDLSARDEAVLKTTDMQMFTLFSNYRDLVVEQFLRISVLCPLLSMKWTTFWSFTAICMDMLMLACEIF